MSIDLDDIESRIATGIYGDDRLNKEERNDAFSALAEVIAEVSDLRQTLDATEKERDQWHDAALDRRQALHDADALRTGVYFALSPEGGANGWRPSRGVDALIDLALTVREAQDAERKRADSLALAYREQQGANDALRQRTEQAERDAEDAEKGAAACDQIVALLDGIPVEAPCPEAARVAALLAEVERLRAGLADIEQIVLDGMAVTRHDGIAEGERRATERIVAWLRGDAGFCMVPSNMAYCDYYAEEIERGEHRKEEK